MNANAQIILKDSHLPIPEIYKINEISNELFIKIFFIRYSSDSGKNSRIISIEELMKEISSKEFNKGHVLSIERAYDCVAGCTVFTQNGVIYGEYVEGHLSALLRRGLCAKRFLINNNLLEHQLDALQGWICLQNETDFKWSNYNGAVTSNFKRITDFLLKKANCFKEDCLYEIIITQDEIVFCDAKILNEDKFSVNFKKIFVNNNIKLKKKNRSNKNELFQVDSFDIDIPLVNKDLYLKKIIIHNGAILSHFITRNFNDFNQITFIK